MTDIIPEEFPDPLQQAFEIADLSPTVRRVIERSYVRHQLNLMFVLWPPLITMLNRSAEKLGKVVGNTEIETAILDGIAAGIKAANDVPAEYTHIKPLRSVDAFADGFTSYLQQRAQVG